MNDHFQLVLIFHLVVMAGMLSLIYYYLKRYRLFHWYSAGFWVAAASAMYFLIVPSINCVTGQNFYLETRLAVTDGIPRILWVTFVIVVGLSCFYGAYFNTKLKEITFGMRNEHLPVGSWIIMVLALLAAAYSIIMFRGSFAFAKDQLLIEGGKFKGDITGYHYVAHMLALFPLLLMLAFKKTRNIGIGLTVIYMVARFEDKWDRQSLVTLLVSISMLFTSARMRKLPDIKWTGVIITIMIILTMRGHTGFLEFFYSDSFDLKTGKEIIAQGGDASMLGTLWVHSYLCEQKGYNFGIPFINSLFGFLPRKYFPWKDRVIEPFFQADESSRYSEAIGMMFGAKSTVIGDFYGWGGIITVSLGMACLGYFSRGLDCMVKENTNLLVRLLGFIWMGSIWMVFGSSLNWGLSCLFMSALPFFVLVAAEKIFLRKEPESRRLGEAKQADH